MEEKRFAVLIDADNISAKYIKYIVDEITNYGVATYKRIYGDWTNPNTSSWKEVLLDNSINPIQQYSYTQGKNATDSAMIIDAMDILYSNNVDGFCIVSSDSDFTRLSARLRESGMLVVGMGERKTPKPFITACNQFKYLDVLAESDKKSLEIEDEKKKEERKEEITLHEVKPTLDVKVETTHRNHKGQNGTENVKNMTDIEVIKSTIIKMMNKLDTEEQGLNIAELGSKLVKRYPDFDVRNYGHTKLSKFLKNFDFLKVTKTKTATYVTLDSNHKESMSIKKPNPRKTKRVHKKIKTK